MCTHLTNICRRCSVSPIIDVLWFRRQPISKLSCLGIYNADTLPLLTEALMCEMQFKNNFQRLHLTGSMNISEKPYMNNTYTAVVRISEMVTPPVVVSKILFYN